MRRTIVAALLLVAFATASMATTFFEDGSWRIGPYGSPLHGCLASYPCDDGGTTR